ncbi:major facilitator superfamily domain-containing protein [Mycena crocata]|nr:major facilitator superfamily domain-containing protein [Mycena crocata]
MFSPPAFRLPSWATKARQRTIDTSIPARDFDNLCADERKITADSYLVDTFDEGSPANPKSRARRWCLNFVIYSVAKFNATHRYLTMLVGVLVLNATLASSAPSGITAQLMQEYHLSKDLVVLAISLFVAGYVVGPLLWGPLSEDFGRRPISIYSFFVYTLFQVATALAKNGASLLLFRFLGGVFAAAPLTNAGALISDIWDPNTRGMAMAVSTLAPLAGPSLGPIIGVSSPSPVSNPELVLSIASLTSLGTDFRWVFWTLAIFAGVCCLAVIFTLPETYTPILLVQIAQKKREETGDPRFSAPMEKVELSVTKR